MPEEFLGGITEKPPNLASGCILAKTHKVQRYIKKIVKISPTSKDDSSEPTEGEKTHMVQRSIKKNVKKAPTSKDDSSETIEGLNLFLQAASDYQPKSEAEPPQGSLSIKLLKHQVSLSFQATCAL